MVDFNGQLQWSASMVDCFGFKVIKDVLGKAIERSNFQLQLKMRTISWKISWLATVRLTTWRLQFGVENLPESDHRKFVIIFIFIFSLYLLICFSKCLMIVRRLAQKGSTTSSRMYSFRILLFDHRIVYRTARHTVITRVLKVVILQCGSNPGERPAIVRFAYEVGPVRRAEVLHSWADIFRQRCHIDADLNTEQEKCFFK